MTATSKPLSRFSIIAAMLIAGWGMSQTPTPTPTPEGRVTQIFHDVQLLPAQADARSAVIDDTVDENTGLKTGDDSRSELTFADLTITRLGANTVFSFNKAGRSVRLDSGSILLYVRKNSGGASISTKAVSVGITGTTLIFESKPISFDRLIVLEGDARFSLNDYPDQSTVVRAGQLLNVRAGSKKLPKPGRVNLKRIVDTHPLIKNFPPLPSLDLILATNQNPNAPAPGPPPSPPTAGQGAVSNPPGYAPNPSGQPPPSGQTWPGYVGTAPSPRPTRTPRHKATPRPTAKPTPTPYRAGSSRPTPMPKKRFLPIKRATPTPMPGHIIR